LGRGSKRIEEHRGVADGNKRAAQLFEFVAQGTVIVDFAVEGNHPAAGRIRHRLGPKRTRIDDGKPTMAKCYAPIIRRPKALAIRSSAPLQFVQTRNNGRVSGVSVKIETERNRYAAHARCLHPKD